MSGGQKINDHSFWAGGKSKGCPFPEGAKTKEQSSGDGTGGLSTYEDTSEKIKAQQEHARRKVMGHMQKPGCRN